MKNLFLTILAILFFIGCKRNEKIASQLSPKTTYDLYVGTYTQKESHVDGKGEGIYRIQLDENLNEISRTVIGDVVNPSFLTFGKNQFDNHFLYCVEETNPDGKITSFSIKDDYIKKVSSQSTEGGSPCHLIYRNIGKSGFLAAANYVGGNIVGFKVDAGGDIEKAHQNMKFPGSSLTERQTSSHPHHLKISESDEESINMIVADLGTDISYDIDVKSDMTFVRNEKYDIKELPGSGPRHLAEGVANVVLNELNSTISVYEGSSNNLMQRLSTIPSDFKEKNSPAEVIYDGYRNQLYVSNRGHNSIAVYRFWGRFLLDFIGYFSTEGKTPRHMSLSHDGKYLFVANQDSDNINIFLIDNKQLILAQEIKVKTPVCVLQHVRK